MDGWGNCLETVVQTLYPQSSHHCGRIMTPPRTLDEYAASLKLQEKLHAEKDETHARFEPLSEQFIILGKYEVTISQEVSALGLARLFLSLIHNVQ